MKAWSFPFLAILLWAGNVVVSKLASGAIAPPAITFYRLVLAVLLMSCFVLRPAWRNRTAIKPQLARLALLGFLSMSFYQCLSYWAADTSTATNMSIITALVPLLTMCLSVWLLREAPTQGMALGGVTALAGIVWLISRGAPAALLRGGLHTGDLLMLIASLSYAFYSILLRKWPLGLPAWQSTYLQALSALVFMVPMFWRVPAAQARLDTATLPLIAYAGVFASVVLPVLWINGIRHLGPNRCSMFINLLPVLTAGLAVILLGERLHGYHLVGGGLAVVGVLASQLLRKPLWPMAVALLQESRS
ncbi:DMT family transporter [Silvimonas sp.]|uniref:DMT family transporter n=1 Tax=Silvimonas sp. TaxID=2650811 RepID=UPI0028481DC7|nr:DMT family transporter [Silvimonas sp.]MDR3426681.1 DMT family transporter [Silvimonas sp.]